MRHRTEEALFWCSSRLLYFLFLHAHRDTHPEGPPASRRYSRYRRYRERVTVDTKRDTVDTGDTEREIQ